MNKRAVIRHGRLSILETELKVARSYVYVVVEHDTVLDSDGKLNPNGKSAIIHGVYINKEEADGKRFKLHYQGPTGYIAVLKKPLHGRSLL